MKHVLIILGIGLVAAWPGHTAPPTDEPAPKNWKYGAVRYPARMNLQVNQGTLELWFKTMAPLPAKPRWQSYFVLAGIYTEPSTMKIVCTSRGLYMSWAVTPESGGKAVGFEPRLDYVLTANNDAAMPQVGVWHHIAYCWQDQETWAYYDGRLVGKTVRAKTALPQILVEDGFVVLGSGKAPVVVDGFCLSSRPRTVEEILARTEKALEADVDTLLLDNFESVVPVGRQRYFKPDFISTPNSKGGEFVRSVEQVKGKFGKGVALYVAPESGRNE